MNLELAQAVMDASSFWTGEDEEKNPALKRARTLAGLVLNPLSWLSGAPPYNGCNGIDLEREVAIPVGNGFLVFPSSENGCSYIRVVKREHFKEVGYWSFQEWEEDPKTVMGTIMNMLVKMTADAMKNSQNSS